MPATASSVAAVAQLADEESWQTELAGTRLVSGAGRLAELGGEATALGGKRALLVTDPGLQRAGHVERAVASLDKAGLETTVFDAVSPDPDSAVIAAGSQVAERCRPDVLVALGGGSSMDAAKGINFVHTNGGRIEDYWGFGRAERPLLPMIALPTTAGTGSDAQSYAVITSREKRRKMACGDRGARFATVILDAELALTAPAEIVGSAGIDALSHALESYVTRKRNPISKLFAAEAFRLLDFELPRLLAGVAGPAGAGRMLLAAHLAGAAIEASMLGAAHAAANPLTTHFAIAHGMAVGLMLPHVVRFNGAEVDALYAELKPGGAAAIAARMEEISDAAGLPEGLQEAGVDKAALADLARAATAEWTGGFNPRSLTENDFLELYETAY